MILVESAMNSGHWTALLRYRDTIEFFDSYGNEPTDILRWTPMKRRRELGEDEDYLTDMFDRTELPVIYNNVQYQSENHEINTCGDFVCLRLYKFIHNKMTLPQFYRMMKTIKTTTGHTYDEIAAMFCDPYI